MVCIANLGNQMNRRNRQWTRVREDEDEEYKRSRQACRGDDEKDVNLVLSHRFGVVIFYNVLVDSKKCNRNSSNVCLRLGLDPRHCPIDLSKCKAIDSCSVGVSTECTVKNSDHLADVLSLQCVLVECKSQALDRNVKWFYGKKELNWYSTSSAVFAELEAGTTHVLERVSNRKVGLADFFVAINWDREVLNQIKKMAREQGAHLHDYSRGQ